MSVQMYTTNFVLMGGLCNLGCAFAARGHTEPAAWPHVVGGLGLVLIVFGMVGTVRFCLSGGFAIFGWLGFGIALVLVGTAALLYRAGPYGFMSFLCVAFLLPVFLAMLVLQITVRSSEEKDGTLGPRE